MRSTWPAVAALVVGPAVLPALVCAQGTTPTTGSGAGAIRVTYLKIGDETVKATIRPLSVEDCDKPVELTFELDGIPEGKQTIDIYEGDMCNATDRKDTTNPRCAFLQNEDITNRQDFVIKMSASKFDCSTGEQHLWFLAVDSSMGSEDVGTGYGDFQVPVDADPPAAPSNVEGGAGEKEIPVSWDVGGEDVESFVVYIDDSATSGDDGADGGTSADGKCRSSRLIAGTDAKDIPKGVRTKTIAEGTATGIDLSSKDIRGDLAAVGVVAVDLAGNKSKLSEIGCVEVVPTEGFWERYEKQGGNADTGCTVHGAPGGAGHDDAHSALALTLGALAVARVRRRRS